MSEKVKVRILGIAGSPRHANTEIMVKEALKATEVLGNVETEFISIVGKKINPCIGDWRCYYEATEERFCPTFKDDMQEIYEAMLRADGIIVGTPVYWGSITAQLKAVLDRTLPFCHYSSTKFKGALSHKVGGALAMAYDRSGGQEYAIQTIHNWMLVQDMIIVGSGPGTPVICYYGGVGHQLLTDEADAVKEDGEGLKSCRGTGIRVAHMAKIIKAGLESLGYVEHFKLKI